jgi:hypothetical protein
MKSLLLPLALAAVLAACAPYAPVAPVYYVITPGPLDQGATPQYAYPYGYASPYPYAYPYAYPDPYLYAPYAYYDPFLFSGGFFCCSGRHHHHDHGMHRTNHWGGGHMAAGRAWQGWGRGGGGRR